MVKITDLNAVDPTECTTTESDESTIEKKSDGLGEKEQAVTGASTTSTIAGPTPSTDLSDFELSDMSENETQALPDYNTLQIQINAESVTQSTNVKETCMDEPSEHSEEEEAACLPADSIKKDCWEQWVDDDRLFNLAEEVNAPSTSAGVRAPTVPSPASPASPATERRRVKFENRRRAREQQQQRAARPVEAVEQRSIFVPTEKVGRILGKGGRRIREIESTTGANIKVVNRLSNKPVTQLIVTGTVEAICMADTEIYTSIGVSSNNSGEGASASVRSPEANELKLLLLGIKRQVIDSEKKCSEP